jgi:hypothetical protein
MIPPIWRLHTLLHRQFSSWKRARLGTESVMIMGKTKMAGLSKRIRDYKAPASEQGQLPWTKNMRVMEIDGKAYARSAYCAEWLPRRPLPAGYFLVHNYVRPASSLGRNGFRAWVQKGDKIPDLIPCSCGFGGIRNSTVNKHYRVKYE